MKEFLDVMKAHCPSCSHPFDSMTCVDGNRLPVTGDLTVCIECADILMFIVENTSIAVRWPTAVEFAALPPATAATLRKVQRAIHRMHGRAV